MKIENVRPDIQVPAADQAVLVALVTNAMADEWQERIAVDSAERERVFCDFWSALADVARVYVHAMDGPPEKLSDFDAIYAAVAHVDASRDGCAEGVR